MCKDSSSCFGLAAGALCENSGCTCTSTESCAGKKTGQYCVDGDCQCSATVPACSGDKSLCQDGICIGKFYATHNPFLI